MQAVDILMIFMNHACMHATGGVSMACNGRGSRWKVGGWVEAPSHFLNGCTKCIGIIYFLCTCIGDM